MKKLLLACAMLATAGCTSLFEGAYQQIAIETDPPRSTCAFYDPQGVRFSEAMDGDIVYNVRRNRLPITVVCSKEGYIDETVVLEPTPNTSFIVGGVFTDMLLTSHYWYPDSISVKLARL